MINIIECDIVEWCIVILWYYRMRYCDGGRGYDFAYMRIAGRDWIEDREGGLLEATEVENWICCGCNKTRKQSILMRIF